jgi:hypothetical protein
MDKIMHYKCGSRHGKIDCSQYAIEFLPRQQRFNQFFMADRPASGEMEDKCVPPSCDFTRSKRSKKTSAYRVLSFKTRTDVLFLRMHVLNKLLLKFQIRHRFFL